MNQLKSTAKKLDTFFRVLNIFLKIGIVCCLVSIGIIAVGYLFDLSPYTIGTGYNSMKLGRLDITIAENYAPDEWYVLALLSVSFIIAIVCLLIARRCCTCVRDILHPMTQGEPFHNTISLNLKKLAKYSLILFIILECMELVTTSMFIRGYHLLDLLLSDKITHVTFRPEIDFTFLIVAAVLYLLSYIFQYGEQLQQLSDETL